MPTIRAPNTWDTFINGMWETGTNYPTISTPQEGLGSDGWGDMTPSQTKVLRVKVYCPKCDREEIRRLEVKEDVKCPSTLTFYCSDCGNRDTTKRIVHEGVNPYIEGTFDECIAQITERDEGDG